MSDRSYYRQGGSQSKGTVARPREPPIPKDRLIKLTTNMYQVEMAKFLKQNWFHYQVVITNKYREVSELFEVKRELLTKLAIEYKTPFAFDGDKILYVKQLLSPIEGKFQVLKDFYVDPRSNKKNRPISEENLDLLNAGESDPTTLFYLLQAPSDDQFYKVSLRQVTFNEESRTQLLQTALNFSSYLSGNFVRGFSFFNLANQRQLGDNWTKILFTGTYQSFRQVSIGTILNVDLSYHVSNWFGNLTQYIGLCLDKADWIDAISKNVPMQKYASDQIKGLTVVSNINKRKYRLDGIDFAKNSNNTFFEHEGNQVSIKEYTFVRYQTPIKYPNLGLAYVSKTNKKKELDYVYLPLESLTILQTKFQGELNLEDRRAMIDQSRANPKGKLESIKKNIKELLENEHWKDFSVNVSPNPIQVTSYVLNAQPLIWNQGKSNIPDEERGWQMNPMHTVATPKRVFWGLVWPNTEKKEKVIQFSSTLVEAADKLGFSMAAAPIQRQTKSTSSNDYLDAIKSIWALPPSQKPFFTIILLTEKDPERYKVIKNFTDVQVGMITKCFVLNSAKKWTDLSIINNMLASINNRALGKNWVLGQTQLKEYLGFVPDTKTNSLCVMGMDLCHRSDEFGNYFNPPVGTVISAQVVDSNLPNFYLYSHKAVAGTARPTHYQVLLNEMNLEGKKMAELTFALAHMHQGCTKSVSVPAPSLLAHKAAYRANSYFGKSTIPHPNVLDNSFMV